MGSLKSPCTNPYRSSIETIALNCLFFEKIAFVHFGDRQTNKQTDEQMDSTNALRHSRCRERRLKNHHDAKMFNWIRFGCWFETLPDKLQNVNQSISVSSLVTFCLTTVSNVISSPQVSSGTCQQSVEVLSKSVKFWIFIDFHKVV